MPEMASGKWNWLQQTVTWQLSGPRLGAISGWQCRAERESLQGVPAEIAHSPWGLSAADINADDIVYAHVGGQGMSYGQQWSEIFSGRGSKHKMYWLRTKLSSLWIYINTYMSCFWWWLVEEVKKYENKPSTQWYSWKLFSTLQLVETGVAAQKYTCRTPLHWLPRDHQ